MTKSPLRSIRAKCLDCCCGSVKTVKYCSALSCDLWYYRFGLRPSTAKQKYGKELLDPALTPDSTVELDDLP